jgi:hypothetical protein
MITPGVTGTCRLEDLEQGQSGGKTVSFGSSAFELGYLG